MTGPTTATVASAAAAPSDPYIDAQLREYNSIRSALAAVRQRATTEGNRALNETEVAQVAQMNVRAKALSELISTLGEAYTCDQGVAAMAARITGGAAAGPGADQGQGSEFANVGGAQTRQRDPGHYRSIKEGGKGSFFGDIYRAQMGDSAARNRLDEHTRSIDTAGEGAGVIPPKWMTDLYEDLPRQGRALANAVRNIPLGDDPRPMSLPRQTAGATTGGAPITVDQAEVTNSTPNTSFTDAWDSAVTTVTPLATTGGQIVTRQLLDMSNPSIDLLIFGDLIEAYNDAVEAKVAAAIATVGTALFALEGITPITDADHYNRVAIDAAMQVRQNRKRPPDIFAMSNIRYGKVLGLVDTTGRPLVPAPQGGAQFVNVAGVGSVPVDGFWHGMGIVATAGFSDDDRFWAVRSSDVLLFESNMYRFRYEQPLGPDLIKLGIWAYTATHLRFGTTSVKRVEIDESA
jgi:HK97 family phage major capsid protein